MWVRHMFVAIYIYSFSNRNVPFNKLLITTDKKLFKIIMNKKVDLGKIYVCAKYRRKYFLDIFTLILLLLVNDFFSCHVLE